jgi:hypothetical protein
MNIEKAFGNNRLLKALTGLNKFEFEQLLPQFKDVLVKASLSKKRQRKVGGGRKGAIGNAKSKLFFILFYLKVYPTFDLAGFIFGTDRTRPCRWYKALLPILEETLGRECVLPERKITSIDDFYRKFPEVNDLFIDGTERPIRRPKNPKNQKKNYSGKKKRHTRKNTIWTDKNKKIMLVSPSKPGRIHDKKQHDKNGGLDAVPPNINKWLDSGYQGVQKTAPNVFIPKKNTKKKPLTKDEKEENRIISHFRIVVENAIGGIKRYGCVSNIYRNFRGIDDKFILLSAALWNFHLKYS